MITREKFETYEDVRLGGETNMFLIQNVIDLSHEELTKDDCLEIMRNYNHYSDKYGDKE